MAILSRTTQEQTGERMIALLGDVHEPNSITSQPAWLDMFYPNMPERKAAILAFWCDLLFASELTICQRVTSGAILDAEEDRILERAFSRMLAQCLGVDWAAHPNAQKHWLR